MESTRPTSAEARPRRGTAAGTRERLVAIAAGVFNREGYHGTDSNRLARAAGYAPATFYKHFPDKRALFLAVYEGWVTAEWAAVEAVLKTDTSSAAHAARLVDMVVALHRRWRGLRASLRALVATDETARAVYRAQRRRQLRFLARLGGRRRARRAEADAVLLFTLERVADALADGEVHDLGLAVAPTLARLRTLVLRHLEERPVRPPRKARPPSSLTPAR
jgi:AcrR family transcriptional regulator